MVVKPAHSLIIIHHLHFLPFIIPFGFGLSTEFAANEPAVAL